MGGACQCVAKPEENKITAEKINQIDKQLDLNHTHPKSPPAEPESDSEESRPSECNKIYQLSTYSTQKKPRLTRVKSMAKSKEETTRSARSHRKAETSSEVNTLTKRLETLNKIMPDFDILKAEAKFAYSVNQSDPFDDESKFSLLSRTQQMNSQVDSKAPRTRREEVSNTLFKTGPIRYQHDNSTYQGDIKDGKRHGIGVSVTDEGDVYKGSWVNDKPCGYGRYLQLNGDCYEGDIDDGKFHGFGKLQYGQIGIEYIGEFRDGKKDGLGKEISKDGTVFEGMIIEMKFY